MKAQKIELNYKVADSLSEFDQPIQVLIKEAIAFAGNAYAPYSNFKVSAALLLDNGQILKGSNIENASYPVSICAERTLLSYTVSNFPHNKIQILAIYVDKDLENPVPPCGICRQTLVEVEQRQQSPISILLIAKEGKILQFDKSADLLPLSFTADFL